MTKRNGEELVKRETVTALVEAYETARRDAADGIALLGNAARIGSEVFAVHDYTAARAMTAMDSGTRFGKWDAEHQGKVEATLLSWAWGRAVELSGVRPLLTAEKSEELEKSLNDNDLPPFTVANVWQFIDDVIGGAGDTVDAKVAEGYGLLLLHKYGHGYKTNLKAQKGVGSKVVLTWLFSGHGHFQGKETCNAIESAFLLLEGKGAVKGYHGDLAGRLADDPKAGKKYKVLDYFEVTAYQNGNVHLELTRPDLLKEMHRRCAGRLLGGDA